MRVMMTGGGTGGHTSPAVAILEELQKRDPYLVTQWVGRAGNIEQRVCDTLSIPFRSLPMEGWPRGQRIRKAWVAAKLGLSILRAAWYIKRFHPQLVIGVGGYVSVPLIWTAQRMNIPTVLHEQNKRLGMANRLLAPRASRVLLSYPDTLGEYPREKAVVVGNPVRAGFSNPPDPAEARRAFGLAPDIPVVLVCGGSQGARTLNAAMAEVIGHFNPDEVQFIWMTGQHGIIAARAAAAQSDVTALPFAFIDDMPAALAACDVVVSRSGASSVAEIAQIGRPSILIPYPHATDNHQEDNARALEKAGGAVVVLDNECSSEKLTLLLRDLLADETRRATMADAARGLAKPGAAEAIAEELLPLAFGDAGVAVV